MNQDKTIYLKN